MAERARNSNGRGTLPGIRTFGSTAASAGQQFSWMWSRESLLRLLLSLLLSLALWLYVSNRENPNVVQDFSQPLPITVSTLPDGTTVGNENLGYVYLRYRRSDPNTIVTPTSFRVFVDLAGLKPGIHRVPIQVVADPGVDVVGKRPSSVRVTLQRLQTRRVPIKMRIITQPPKGYGSSISFRPKSVMVSGPADLVSQVQRATAYLELGDLKSTLKSAYKLNPENNEGSVITGQLTLQPPDVHVTMSVQPFSSYKTLPVLVQFSGLPKQGFGVAGVTVTPPQIAASASPSALSRISTVRTRSISVNKRGGGSFRRKVGLQLPGGVHAKTHYVTVHVKIAPIQSSTSVEIGIQPKGVTPGLIMHTIPGRVLVTVSGPANALHGVARNTHATVDLSGYGAGVYQLRPRITSDHRQLHVEAVYPGTVTVQLRPSS